jgi:enoyl-CoA hydratase/carnithine racemase
MQRRVQVPIEEVPPAEVLFAGSDGYVQVRAVAHAGLAGALLYYANPDPRKLHAVDTKGMQEWEAGVAAIEQHSSELDFAIFFGAYDSVHAGADITEFAGEPNYLDIRKHLLRGAHLDAKIKQLWPKLRTVGVFCGDRYGGSLEWPLFAEWGVADERCRAQFSEVHLGIIPGWNGVLNVLLKSEATNALYLGQTGNTVTAKELFDIGLVQRLVHTPAPPDRKTTDPAIWPEAAAAHATYCNDLLLEAALELATQGEPPQRETLQILAGLEELFEELRRRTDPAPYRRLHDEIAARAAQLAPDDIEGQKALSKEVGRRLAELGKPLAPLGVRAVADYVGRWNPLTADQILASYLEAGEDESNLCADLMDTLHRVIGVHAVLSKNIADKVPVFE